MSVRRFGSPTKFWNNVGVLANGVSTPVYLPRGVEQIALFMTVSAATTITLEAAHHGADTAEGNEADESTPPATWFTAYYVDSPIQVVFASAGAAAQIIPDFEPAWIRLRSSGVATITAGFEVTGD